MTRGPHIIGCKTALLALLCAIASPAPGQMTTPAPSGAKVSPTAKVLAGAPTFAIRGQMEPLPADADAFRVPVSQPEGEGASHANHEDPLDHRRWQQKLQTMRIQHLNTLVLVHPDPLPLLLPSSSSPTNGPISSATPSTDLTAWLDWLLPEAARAGIDVYLWPADLPLSAGLRTAHTENIATPSVVGAIFARYPRLAGWVMRGAGRVDDIKTLRSQIIAACKQAGENTNRPGHGPAVWLDPQGLSPEVVAAILSDDARMQLLIRIDGDLTEPLDSAQTFEWINRIAEAAHRSPADLPTVAFLKPPGGVRYLLWSDPPWIDHCLRELHRHGVHGFLFPSPADLCEPTSFWLTVNAWTQGLYALPGRYLPEWWQKRLDDTYGVGKYAGQLLECIEHASAILPEIDRLLPIDDDRYMPQMGLPLIHCDQIARLAGHNSEQIASAIITLKQHLAVCRSRLPALRHLKTTKAGRQPSLTHLLDRIEMNLAMGEYFAYRLESLLAVRKWDAQLSSSSAIAAALYNGIQSWERVVQLADRLYPDTVSAWQLPMVSGPPWTLRDVVTSFHPIRTHWRDHLEPLRNEAMLIRSRLLPGCTAVQLPLSDEVHDIRPTEPLPVYVLAFDHGPDRRVVLRPGASFTTDPDTTIEGKGSVLIDTRALGDSPRVHFQTDPSFMTLQRYHAYRISLIYRSIDSGQGPVDPFEIGLISEDEPTQPLGDDPSWTAPPGYQATRVMYTPVLTRDDVSIYVKVYGRAALAIDHIEVRDLILGAHPVGQAR